MLESGVCQFFLQRAWNEVGGSLPGETIESGKHLLDSFFHVLEDWYDLIVDVSVSFLRGIRERTSNLNGFNLRNGWFSSYAGWNDF